MKPVRPHLRETNQTSNTRSNINGTKWICSNSTWNVKNTLFRLYNIEYKCHNTSHKPSNNTNNNSQANKQIFESITYCNIQGNVNHPIQRKLDITSPIVRDIIIKPNTSLVALAEFQVNPKYIKSPQDCTLLAYNEIIKDSSKSRGPGAGGIAVYAKISKAAHFSHMKPVNSENKCYICIKNESLNTVIIFIYVKPAINNKAHSTTSQTFDDISKECEMLINNKYNIICMGDFNAKVGNIVGDNDLYAFKNENDFLFYQFSQKFNFLICNSYWQYGIPTRYGRNNNTIIDYALLRINNDQLQISSFNIHNKLDYWTDHRPISVKLSFYNTNIIDIISDPASYRTILLNDNDEAIAAAMMELEIITSSTQRNLNKHKSNKEPINKNGITILYNKFLKRLNQILVKHKIKKFKRLNTKEDINIQNKQINIKLQRLDKIIHQIEILHEQKSNNSILELNFQNELRVLQNRYNVITEKIEHEKSQKIIRKLESNYLYGDVKFAYQMLNSFDNNINKNQPLIDNHKLYWKTTDKLSLMWNYFQKLYTFNSNIIHPRNLEIITEKLNYIKLINPINTNIYNNKKSDINIDINRNFTRDELLAFAASEKYRKKLNKAWGLDLISNKIVFYCIFKSKQTKDRNGNIIDSNVNNKNVKQILKIFNFILQIGEIPQHFDWDHLIIIPKKLDAAELKDFRGISLQVAFYKLLDSLITKRIEPIIESQICKEQGGFRHFRGVMEQLFCLRTIILHYRQRLKKPLFLAFMDFEKAYDTVWIERLLVKMWDIGIQGRIWNYFKCTYCNIKCSVEINNVYSSPIFVTRGLRQGGTSSPPLFNISINDLIKLLNKYNEFGVKIGLLLITCLMFADDLALLADCIENLQLLILICAKWAFWAGAKFNAAKCKILIITPRNSNLPTNNNTIFLPIYANSTNANTSTNTDQTNFNYNISQTIQTLLHKQSHKNDGNMRNVSKKHVQILCDHINNWSIFETNETNSLSNTTNTNNIQIQNLQIIENTNLVLLNITQEGDGCKYLGIIQQNGETYLQQRLKLVANSKSAMCKLMNFQEIGDANNIQLSITMYQTITRAIMLCGSETLRLSESFIDTSLESIQHQSLCFIFGVFRCVIKPFLRLIAGLPPIIAIWHFNRLKAYFKIFANTHNLNSIATDVAREDFKMFNTEMLDPNNRIAGTMTDEIWELLLRYNLQNMFKLLHATINQTGLNFITNKCKSTIWSHFWQADFAAIKGAATLKNFDCNLIKNSSKTYAKANFIKWTQYSNNRKGVKWLYRIWSGRMVNTFYNDTDRKYCDCRHCGRSINHLLFIKHILQDCSRLNETRINCNIDSNNDIKYLLNDNGTNIHNMIKFLSRVME